MLYRLSYVQHSWYRVTHYQEEPRLFVREFRLTPARAHITGAWADLKVNIQMLEHSTPFDQRDTFQQMLPDEIRHRMVRVLGHARTRAYLERNYRDIQMEYGALKR